MKNRESVEYVSKVKFEAFEDVILEAVEELREEQKQQRLKLSQFESKTYGFLCGAVLSLALVSLFQQRH